MIFTPLTTHSEKIEFLINYMTGPHCHAPLMIVGSGGNGKTNVLLEVAQRAPVNMLLFYPQDGHRFYPASTPSDICVVLIHANGTPSDYSLASSLNANMVEFKKDPAYLRLNTF